VPQAEAEQKQEPKAEAQQQGETQSGLPANMQRILDTKLQGAGLTLEQLTEGFGAVSPANINHAFKWITENKAS